MYSEKKDISFHAPKCFVCRFSLWRHTTNEFSVIIITKQYFVVLNLVFFFSFSFSLSITLYILFANGHQLRKVLHFVHDLGKFLTKLFPQTIIKWIYIQDDFFLILLLLLLVVYCLSIFYTLKCSVFIRAWCYCFRTKATHIWQKWKENNSIIFFSILNELKLCEYFSFFFSHYSLLISRLSFWWEKNSQRHFRN